MKNSTPAFPAVGMSHHGGQPVMAVFSPGMTTRQYYKAAALQGIIARLQPNELGNQHISHASTRLVRPSEAARDAGRYADAMLAEDDEAGK